MSLPTYKEIIELLKKGATVEAQEQIMELREAVITLQEENFELRNKIRKLDEKLRIKGQLKFSRNVYWSHEGQAKDGPFCPRCFDIDQKLARLQDYGDCWYCVACKQGYDLTIV